MIQRSNNECQTEKVTTDVIFSSIDFATQGGGDWKSELSNADMEVRALLNFLLLSESQTRDFLDEHDIPENFPLRVPPSYLAQIEKGNPRDPLLLQVLPRGDELVPSFGFNKDPLKEEKFNAAPGIIHKYRGRALLTVTQACAIHCRYCFRRHFSYQENTGSNSLETAFEYLAKQNDVTELILSGGDPLSVSDSYLQRVISLANSIPQLKRLRIHTRMPIVLPSRINNDLLKALESWRGQLVVVVHSNHAAEISQSVINALSQLRSMGALLLNQSVLLKGINDNALALTALSERLFDAQVLPYYLHQLDPVEGAQHFMIEDNIAKGLIRQVSASLPGYLVPRLVREIPGRKAKTLL